MAWLTIAKSVLTRTFFIIHGIITIQRVTDVFDGAIYALLLVPVCLIILELVLTLKLRPSGEWGWFCPSSLLYLASILPGLWLLHLDLYNQRACVREFVNNTSNSPPTTQRTELLGVTVELSDDGAWALALEQFVLVFLILGRWFLPKGRLTRQQLSQLLLVYIGMAADILEFSMESLSEEVVMCDFTLTILILSLWSWSLLQFTFVLSGYKPHHGTSPNSYRCCQSELWALCVLVVMQDGPFLALRLYLLLGHSVINQMMLFFTAKNILVIMLQIYRMLIVCCSKDHTEWQTGIDLEQGEDSIEKQESIDVEQHEERPNKVRSDKMSMTGVDNLSYY